MKILITAILMTILSSTTLAQVVYKDVPFQQKVIKADAIFQENDVKVKRVEEVTYTYMTGLGKQVGVKGYKVTIKVKDYHYSKKFFLNGYGNFDILSFDFLWDEGEFDILQVFIPAYRGTRKTKIHFVSDYHRRAISYDHPLKFDGDFLTLELEIAPRD